MPHMACKRTRENLEMFGIVIVDGFLMGSVLGYVANIMAMYGTTVTPPPLLLVESSLLVKLKTAP